MRAIIGKTEAALRGGWAGLRRGLVDLLFPGACVSCGIEFESDLSLGHDLPFCRACLESLDLFHGPTCAKCGFELSDAARSYVGKRGGCVHCDGRKLWFDAAMAAGRYTGRLRELLLRMKHREGQSLSLAVGRLVTEQCRDRLADVNPDVVVPVPMHWRRRLARGTNSAAILAEVLAGRVGAPHADGLLRRRRHTVPQSECTPARRWDNVRRAFAVGSAYHLKRAHVLLVDDILTTGATCSEAARALRRAGAEQVTVVVVARAVSR